MFSSTLQRSLLSNKGVKLARAHLSNSRSKVTQTYATSILNIGELLHNSSKQKYKAPKLTSYAQ